MAHGTSATVAMVAIDYARVFAHAGIAALVYDHRNFGRSGGEPRGEINPWVQCRGYVDALSWVAAQPEVDDTRLAAWGDSYSAGEVVVVAACDARVKVVIGQCPAFGTEAPAARPGPEAIESIRATMRNGDVRGTPETTVGPMPVVSPDPGSMPSLLVPIQAFRWFIDYGGRPGSGWINRVTRVVPPTPTTYSPFLCAPWVQASVLLMVAPEDEMQHANPAVTRQAYELIPGPKRWVDIADGHFGLLYHPGARFDQAAAIQRDFLVERLLISAVR
ncbi:MAG: hypothetical protein KGI90_05820 [Burkholderiales bacterium]|nr:hypothetical protein [Burkholderiales bacterium]